MSSGDSALDAYTCGIIVKRAKFLPAKWTDGSPAYAVVRAPVTWAINNSPSPPEADVLLSVNQLPKGARSLVDVSVEIAADENGHLLTCAEYSAVQATRSKRRFPELVAVACQQVMASFTASPPLDASGKTVRSVQSVSVQFKRDH
jgi:hypothetical protein